jgi:mRNA interferase HicA
MKRQKLLSHLRRHGCRILRQGARHTIVLNPANNVRVPVPRHPEVDTYTARAICKQLGIPILTGR